MNSETKDKEESESLRHVSLISKQATCKVCGLTARNETELEDHVHHAHKNENNKVPGKS